MSSIITDSHIFNTDTSLLARYSTRMIYRHESNEGSVIEFDYWGAPMKLFVADAKYRGFDLAYDTELGSHGNPHLSVTTLNFNGSEDDDNKHEALSYTKNDAWIQSTYAELTGDGTAKSNTDKLMEYSTTQAAHHCRNQNISGIGALDLPNLYELIILYLESDNIDALDPTVASNIDKALGKMNTYGRFNFDNNGYVWSSTGKSTNYAWNVHNTGNAHSLVQYYRHCGVVPVKELDA